jgi:hypothetical protein
MKSSQGSQMRTCKQTKQMKLQQTLNINNQENLKPHHYIYIRGNKLPWNGRVPSYNDWKRTLLLQSTLKWNDKNQCDHIGIVSQIIKQLQQEKIVHHMYQIREEGAYRVKGKVIPLQALEALRIARGWDSHIFRYSAHRWRQGCQPYVPATFYPQESSWYSFLLEAESTPGP